MVNKMDGQSLDMAQQNIERLKELFPEVLTDGEKVDFDMLKTVLGEVVDEENERYQFTWHGKKKMIAGTQKPSKGTLRPVPEKSKNFDTTENLYIEGDNLEALKLLQKSYNGKIKMIYIDPPYNTGKDFVYKDNFKDGVHNYLEQTGQVDAEGNIISTNTESNGRFHTDWLNMIYARLKLARNLLTDDGVIFISIDDIEMSNLKKIMNEIFGEENSLSDLVWDLGTGTSAGHFTRSHEYIIAYAKNKNLLPNFSGGEGLIEDRAIKKISQKNPASSFSFPAGIRFEAPDNTMFAGEWGSTEKIKLIHGSMIARNGKLDGPVTLEAGWAMKKQMETWFNNEETFDSKGQKVLEFYFNSSGILRYVKERSVVNPPSVLKEKGSTRLGTQTVEQLLGINNSFDFPKPVELIKFLCDLILDDKSSIILDFFSGSATTAHATIQLNAEDGGKRKFIMVQLPELLDEKSEAYKDGYRTICDIGEERIRRAGEKVKTELQEKQQKAGMLDESVVDAESLDIGFKVLKLDISNIREWNANFDDLEEELDLFESPFVEERSELDVVYEIMLKQGLELTYPIDTFDVSGKTVYDIAFGSLFICLAKDITTDVAKAIIGRKEELGTETSSAIFADHGFKNDSEKLNCIELLKDAGYPEDNLLTI